jgi:hypothetical protein
MTAYVVVKNRVRTPDLLRNFIDFGFSCLTQEPTTIPAVALPDGTILNPLDYYRLRVRALPAIDTAITVTFNTSSLRNANHTIEVILGNNRYNINATNASAAFTARGFPQLIPDFMSCYQNIYTITCGGPYIDFLSLFQDGAYLASKMIIVCSQMREMSLHGLSANETPFVERVWSGSIAITARHALKPRIAEARGDEFKISWHRNSDVQNESRAFMTSALYIHRDAAIAPNSGGISFARNGKEVRVFPNPGTVVSFFDQHVIHKVIPVRVNSPNRTTFGFVQRSAVFMAWFTTESRIITSLASFPANRQSFTKPGVRLVFRDLKKLYILLKKYFTYIARQIQSTEVEQYIMSGSNANINTLYRGAYGITEENAANYRAIHTAAGEPANSTRPVADMVLYKMLGTPMNSTPRRKLLDLFEVFKDLHASFGGGVPRPGKQTARRGGRAQLNIAASGFIRNIT